jgi:hypothetical protein
MYSNPERTRFFVEKLTTGGPHTPSRVEVVLETASKDEALAKLDAEYVQATDDSADPGELTFAQPRDPTAIENFLADNPQWRGGFKPNENGEGGVLESEAAEAYWNWRRSKGPDAPTSGA